MTKRLMAAVAAVCAAALLPVNSRAQNDDNEAKRLRDSTAVFGEIMAAADKAIPTAILGKAAGIAIFPSTVKAGFVFGGMRGRGVLSARGQNGWSSPAFLTLTGGSFGLQIGGAGTATIPGLHRPRGPG